MKMTVAYIGNFGFPDKNASGKRVLGNCKLLQLLNYRVICVAPGNDSPCIFDDITVYSVNSGNGIKRVLFNQTQSVKKIITSENVDIVILYGALFTQKENSELITWCHNNRIKVYYDHVDWLELNWHNPFRAIIRGRNYYYLNNKVIPHCDGVICISNYLSAFHSNNGKNTVVIPPLAVVRNINYHNTYQKRDAIHFIYAGTTSDIKRPTSQWKDRIDIMLACLNDCKNERDLHPFIIDIYGMTEEQYINMFPIHEIEAGRKVIEELDDRVCFHGSIPNCEVMKKTGLADYSVLIRDKKRSTMAGFPTKVSESITCGTPVLCNDTSDIKHYIVEGKTGFVMDDVAALFNKALSLEYSEVQDMKQACNHNPFYYELFEDAMKQFLKR